MGKAPADPEVQLVLIRTLFWQRYNIMKIVLDTSVIVAALFNSKSKNILNAWQDGKLTFCYSQAILNEYQHIIGKIPPLRKKSQIFFAELQQSKHTLYIEKPSNIQIKIDDPADKKFMECAVAASADFIISLDAHLLDIIEYNDIPTVRPVAFLNQIKLYD